MKVNLLALGTIVLLKGGTKKIMITGFGPIDANNVVYDYSGCLYPEGVMSSEETLLFNHDQLESLFFNGYFDNEALEFMKKAQPLIEQAKLERSGGATSANVAPEAPVAPTAPVAQPNVPQDDNIIPDIAPRDTATYTPNVNIPNEIPANPGQI